MNAPGITVEKKEQSSVRCHALDGEDVRRALHAFRGIIRSCYGPNAKLKMLRNACGGHVTVTSSSSRLLSALSLSSPILKLLVTAVEGHLNSYRDGGLFTCCLATTLLEQSLDKAHIHRKLLADMHEYLLSECLAYLRSDSCSCTFKIGVADLATLRCIVQCVLSTKPVGVLQRAHIRHLTSLVVEAFLRSYTVKAENWCYFAPVSFVCVEGRAPSSSRIIDGVLFETSTTSLQRVNKRGGDSLVTATSSSEIETHGKVKVALVTVSMSGDTADYLDVAYEVTDGDCGGRDEVSDATIGTMLRLCDGFAEEGVALVLCQKVIHPRVIRYLQKKKLLAVERLGAHHVRLVEELTGAVGINSVHSSHCVYGWLDSVAECALENKKYLHLQREGASVCSLVLYHRMEESLHEVKAVCESALSTLRLCLQEPYVLSGAGCWQVHLAAYIKHQIRKVDLKTLRNLGCTKLQFEECCLVFASSLEKTASALDSTSLHLVDSTNFHHWMTYDRNYDKLLPESQLFCGCGSNRDVGLHGFCELQEKFSHNIGAINEACFSKSGGGSNGNDVGDSFVGQASAVVDSLAVMCNALRVAVSTCSMLLGISNIVTDEN